MKLVVLFFLFASFALFAKEKAEPTHPSSIRLGGDAGNAKYLFGSLEALIGVSPELAVGAAIRSTRTKEGIAREGELILDAIEDREVSGRFSLVAREGPAKIRALGALGSASFWLTPPEARLATTLQLDFGLTFYRLTVTTADSGLTVAPVVRQFMLGIGMLQDFTPDVAVGFNVYGYNYNAAENVLLRLVQGSRLLENSSVGLAASFPRFVGVLRMLLRLHHQWSLDLSANVSRTVLSEQGVLGGQTQLKWMPTENFGIAGRAGAIQAQSDRRIYDYNLGLELEILW